MDIVALLVILGFSFAFLFGLPFGIAEVIYRFLKRIKFPFYLRWIALIPAFLALYLLGLFIFPDKHLYKLDYWEIMAYQFPDDATFFYQQSKKTHQRGEDFSFGMQTTPENYNHVSDIIKRRGFTIDTTTKIPDTIQTYLNKNKQKILSQLSLKRYSNADYYVVLCGDSSTIFMRKVLK